MKKLLLTVLALIVMAGAVFASSPAWSQSDCLGQDVVYLSGDFGEASIVTALCPASAVIQENILQNTSTDKTYCYEQSPAAVTCEELEVSSWYSISGADRNTVNPKNDIADNRPGEKRVAILLC